MSQIITAQSLPVIARQKIDAPIHTKFLDVQLDHRHNNCLLWSLANNEDGVKKENVEIIMLKLNDALEPANAKYIGTFKDNSGVTSVFAIRDSERLFGIGAATEAKK